MKVVINRCYGNFGLSDEAIELYLHKKGTKCFKYEMATGRHGWVRVDDFTELNSVWHWFYTVDHGLHLEDELPHQGLFWDVDIPRNDPVLIAVVEELGDKANGRTASLRIVDIPDDVKWQIREYGGMEEVHEVHRAWW